MGQTTGSWQVVNVSEHLLRASPEGDKGNAFLVEPVEVGIGGDLGIEDEFLGASAGTLLPIVNKLEDLIVLFRFTQLPIGVAENPRIGIVGEKCQDTLLAAATFRDVVFLHQGIVAMKGNGVEVEVKRRALFQSQAACGLMPQAHEGRIAGGVDAAGVLGQKGTLGHDIEPGKER